jgi:hypothetical protein
MRTIFLAGTLLAGFLTLGGSMAWAQGQQPPAAKSQWSSTDLAMTYTTEGAKVTPGSGNFWFQGGSIDGGITFFRGFGLATNMTVEHASHYAPGLNMAETFIMAGPRYTLRRGSKHESRIFVEAFAGELRASGDVFPTSRGITNKADAFAWQAGAGWDISITKHIALRAFEADYLRTYLPNNGDNTQGQIRLAVGVAYHIQGH